MHVLSSSGHIDELVSANCCVSVCVEGVTLQLTDDCPESRVYPFSHQAGFDPSKVLENQHKQRNYYLFIPPVLGVFLPG